MHVPTADQELVLLRELVDRLAAAPRRAERLLVGNRLFCHALELKARGRLSETAYRHVLATIDKATATIETERLLR